MLLIVALASGVVGGILLRGHPRVQKALEVTTSATIFLLLFLLGLSVGSNSMIMAALRQLGVQALALSLGSVAGSVLLSLLLYRRFFQSATAHEE